MSFRAINDYRLISLNGSKYPWGGTNYTNVMISSDYSVTDELGVNSGMTYNFTHPGSGGASGSKTFTAILPEVYDVVSVFDGTMVTVTKLTAQMTDSSSTAHYVRLDSCEIGLYAIDSDGNERTIVSPVEVWDGTLQTNMSSQATTIFMNWEQISDAEININERLLIKYTIDYYVTSVLSRNCIIRVANSRNWDETTLSLPAVIQ